LIGECLLFCVLFLWFVLTALRQTQRLRPAWLRRLDPLGLVPSWRFFGPNPTTWDYYLNVRYGDGAGSWGPWIDITPGGRGKFAFLWNPRRRPRKVFGSACRQILSPVKDNVKKTTGYQVVLAYVLSRPIEAPSTRTQFEITRSRALIDPENREPRFRSEEYARIPEAHGS
jgi:hypothetical protein